MGDSRRLALKTLAGAPGHVHFDGDRLVANEAVQAAQLVEHGGQFCGNVLVVGGAFRDGYRSGGRIRRGFQ